MDNISFTTSFTGIYEVSAITGTFSPGNGEFKLPPNQEYGRHTQMDTVTGSESGPFGEQYNALGFNPIYKQHEMTGPHLMDNRQYFTPSIEDIRVGYECEQSFITTYDAGTKSERVEESWTPVIIQHIHNYQHPKIKNPVYRVPYLTKEQIEAEGWDENGNKGEYHLEWGSVKKGDLFFVFISISREKNQLYGGRCNDINTFRYICKLLGI